MQPFKDNVNRDQALSLSIRHIIASQTRRVTHPALYPSQMTCRRIVSLYRDSNGIYHVAIIRLDGDTQVLECNWVSDIKARDGEIHFIFVRHFEDAKRAALHAAFFHDDYDDLGDLPEY